MKAAVKISVVFFLVVLLTSCNATRRLSEGQYLLNKVTIEEDKLAPKAERVHASEVRRYVKQSRNKRFLGMNFYVWVYNLANPEKQNKWNNMKRRIGQEPVVVDLHQTLQSVDNIKIYLDSKGFFSSRVDYRIDTMSRKRKVAVTYSLRQYDPYTVNRLRYEFRDRYLAQILNADTVNTLIHAGDRFDISVLDKERKRIVEYLHRKGYYDFSVNNIEYIADTVTEPRKVNVRLIVKRVLSGYNAQGKAMFANHALYTIKDVNIHPDYRVMNDKPGSINLTHKDTTSFHTLNVLYSGARANVRPRALFHQVSVLSGSLYNKDLVSRTYNNLMQMGYFKSARIVFTETRDSVASMSARADSIAGLYPVPRKYLNCDIYCMPAKKQALRAELEGSTTSSFYGLKVKLGYSNRNLFRGAEQFDISGSIGYEYMRARSSSLRRNAIDLGVSAALTFPRALFIHTSPLSKAQNPKTKIELSVNYQNKQYYRRVITSATLSYMWRNSRNSSFVFRPLNINWVHVGYLDDAFFDALRNEYLRRSFQSQFIMALSGTYIYNSARTNPDANQTVVRVNVETSGNLLNAFNRMFGKLSGPDDYFSVFGVRYSQYVRADVNASYKLLIGKEAALVSRIYAGVGAAYSNSVAMPFDRMFYVGGSNSMRGWAPRTLGPGSTSIVENDLYPTQLGDVKLEANLELRFPIWGILKGATFFDAGNVWYMKHKNVYYDDDAVFRFNNFYKQLGFNTGLGIRLDIKFAILRLDWGIQLHNPGREVGQRWIHDFKFKNMAINFGVGYPF